MNWERTADTADQISEFIKDFIDECKSELESDVAPASIQDLQEEMRKDGDNLTKTINELGIKVVIVNPSSALEKNIVWADDKRSGSVNFSVEEDRWLRADDLWGDKILNKLDFKYK